MVFYTALGLGFLTKGPVILLLVLVALIPYLVFSRRLAWGTRRLFHGWGLLLFAILAFGWPILVLRFDPQASQVWLLEMAEKTGISRILEHRRHAVLSGTVARPGSTLDSHRRARPGIAVFQRPNGLAHQRSRREPRRRSALGVAALACLVVGDGQSGRLQPLGDRQAELLRPLHAGDGVAHGRNLGATDPRCARA